MNIMDVLPGQLKMLWDAWGIYMLVIVSFALQIVLTLFGSRRRYKPEIRIRFTVWFAYFLSDAVEKIIMGKLTTLQPQNAQQQHTPTELKALLAPLLLVQIGNPDAITAYSIEDNRLGLRQILSLLFQVGVVVYIMIKCWTDTLLSFLYFPTFSAGIIKYGESVWALKSAFWNSGLTIEEIDQEEHAPALLRKLPEDIAGLELILKGYYRFNCLKPHLENWLYQPFYESLPWMSIDEYSAEDVFTITDAELGFMYDVLYTKAPIVYTWIGLLLRIISFFGLAFTFCVLTIMFKDGFLRHMDAGFTYFLVIGAIMVEVYQIILLPFSDWAIVGIMKHHYIPMAMPCLRVLVPRSYKWKRWSNKLGQFSLLDFSLHDKQLKLRPILKFRGFDMKLRKHFRRTRVDFPRELKNLVVQEMKEVDRESGSKPITQRGQWALERYGCLNHDFKWSVKRDFDKSITIWHIATDICYHADVQSDAPDSLIEMSRLLSNYMMYLLVMRPHMLCSTIGNIVFQHASTELIEYFRTHPLFPRDEREACKILRTEEIPKDRNSSRKKETVVTSKWNVLKDAQRLARNLMARENRWQIISSMWIEMLCYAASKCPVDYHAGQLRRGGGLITHVWLLLAHKTNKFNTSD